MTRRKLHLRLNRKKTGWIAASFLGLAGIGSFALLQLTAKLSLSKVEKVWLPLATAARCDTQAKVATFFPFYTLWHWLVRYKDLAPGYYELTPQMSALEAWLRLHQGRQTPLRLYLPPQRSPGHLARFLGTHLAYDSAQWALTFASYPWEKLGLNAYTWLAIFLPDVYEVYWTISPVRFIERMKENYDRFWNAARRQAAAALGFTPIEVITLASILEYETCRHDEKPLIAGVYLNRLRLGMPLQADPTVIYALGNFNITRVTKRMLEVESPYNTYRRRGLPPGPIGTPSLESIEAVLHYKPSRYLYFCARPDGSGYHDFSATYPEHLVKARAYQRSLNRWLAQKR